MNLSRARIIVSGSVQGVGYRYFVTDQAKPLGLAGFVKNLPDGTVEVVVEGDKGRLEEFISILKAGSYSASVRHLKVSWENPTLEFQNFNIRF